MQWRTSAAKSNGSRFGHGRGDEIGPRERVDCHSEGASRRKTHSCEVDEIMRIENAIKRIHSSPDSWVRVEEFRRIPKGLELCVGVYEGRRTRRAEAWRIKCRGVREFQIVDFNGGGFALCPGTHPAARQFLTRQGTLRWQGMDPAALIGTLCQAHVEAVDDWIPIDRYVDFRAISKKKFVCRGPDFLMRAYAKALRLIGARPQLRLREKFRAKSKPLRVLHFGASYVVATALSAEPQA
jgi:hypothetical protein